MRDGRVVAEMSTGEIDEHAVVAAATGGAPAGSGTLTPSRPAATSN
jgi:hypothetical protein